MNPLDIVGSTLKEITVKEHIGLIGRYRFYACVCSCGKDLKLRRQALTGKRPTTSCGCRHPQRLRFGDVTRKHGLAKTSIHNRWVRMLARCQNPDDPKYSRYGARGIRVCERWLRFENFFEDMGHPPTPNHSLDRIDVNGDYTPGNVRWADQKTQQNNRANNRWLTYRGETRVVTEWAEIVGIPYRLLRQRIDRDGWSVEEAFTTPQKRVYQKKESPCR